jgi:protein-tyrosine phosphatase
VFTWELGARRVGVLPSASVPTAVAHVDVDTQPDGTLLVRWEFEGEPVAVDVATGPTADHLDHRHEITVGAGRTTLHVSGDGARRRFVSVAPHGGGPALVAADRRVPFEGSKNFRDLGGYRTRAGRAVRWGLVFRSDSLHGLSAADLALYEQLGLRAVYDLRGEAERQERPDPVPSRHLAIVGQPADAPSPVTQVRITTADGEQLLHDLYVAHIDHAAVQIGELFTGLVADDGLPAVFHCHAGKDRTGIVAALLLEVLGVEREAVLDDYELTARYRLRPSQEDSYQRLIDLGMSPEAAAGVLTTPRWAMARALADLDARYGGVEPYLTGPAGMRRDDLEALRKRLLTVAG